MAKATVMLISQYVERIENYVNAMTKAQKLEELCKTLFTQQKRRHRKLAFWHGLYICRLLCEKHGGELKLKNCKTGAKATAIFFKI